MIENLIYDVGMHTADDTKYYLTKGYRVIAIEANPYLVEKAQQQFKSEVSEGRLVILNYAIWNKEGQVDFWINEEQDGFSSMIEEIGRRNGMRGHAIKVECIEFQKILSQYGVPYYLKIDIELADKYCLLGLEKDDLPKYISIEAHTLDYLQILVGLGYNAFKCVDQTRHNYPSSEIPNENFYGYLRQRISHDWRRFEHYILRKKRLSPTGYYFSRGSSGPFGEDLQGSWQSFEEVAYNWLHVKMGYKHRGTLNPRGWFDFHATRLHP